MNKISVVINTLNEEKKLPRALASVKGFANEVVVVDMMSTDKTVEIAKKFGAVVYKHKKVGYVEPARNFGIEKAKYDWIFVLDADERISASLKEYLKKEVKSSKGSYYRIPRKNVIFGKWMRHSGWWPDYNIRFFKKGSVSWNEVIHSVPMTTGVGVDVPDNKELSIIHNHYESLEEYITRMNRYTTIQAKKLNKDKVEFVWSDIVSKPLAEFLSRYFAQEGYKDGLHGFSLSLLQGFSEMVTYLKLWQKAKFEKKQISSGEFETQIRKACSQLCWWQIERKIILSGFIKSIWLKITRKLRFQ